MQGMPTNFVPSLIEERWTKNQLNLPSSVFKPQIDPNTMLWKECLEIRKEEVKEADIKNGFIPKARPTETFIGCQILFDEAIGVTLPQDDGFNLEDIVKRQVRIAIQKNKGKHSEIVGNAIQIPAFFNQKDAEDIWKFDKGEEKGLSTILFRTTQNDGLDDGGKLIFELVVSVKKDNKIIEMSCGAKLHKTFSSVRNLPRLILLDVICRILPISPLRATSKAFTIPV